MKRYSPSQEKILLDYIKTQLRNGYSAAVIKRVMIQSGYKEQYVDHLFKQRDREKNRMVLATASAVLAICLLYVFSFNGLTGYIVKTGNVALNQDMHIKRVFLINGATQINLSEYFINEGNTKIVYNVGIDDSILVAINGEIATFTPKEGYKGEVNALVSAYDGKNLITKNMTLLIQ